MLQPNFTLEEVTNYDYVAWVKVKGILPFDSDGQVKTPEERFFWADIQENHRFKGKTIQKLKIRGGHPDLGFVTSCYLGLDVGEEWVLFGKEVNGELIVDYCSRSQKYRDKDGFRDWNLELGIKELIMLDSAFNQGKLDIRQTAKDTLYFENGQIERIKIPLKEDGLAEVSYFTPEGNLIGIEYLKNGLRHGTFSWNYKNSTRMSQKNYRNGVQVGMDYFWTQNDPNQPKYESLYDDQGQFLFLKEYSIGINGRWLSQETSYDSVEKKLRVRFFDESGKLLSEEISSN